jgi:hypothetical protein
VITDGIELVIIIVATFGQAVSGNGHAVGIIGVIVVWRFLVSILLVIYLVTLKLTNLRWVLALVVTTHLALSSPPNSPLLVLVDAL